MCDCLKISKSGFYDFHGRAPSKRSLANAALLAQIEAAHTMSDATYGMPRIRAELADQGVVASRKRIATFMRLSHIRGVSRRRGYVVTTTRGKRQRPARDLVKRQFVATGCQPVVGGRHDLRADMGGFPVFGGGHGRVQPLVWWAGRLV